VRLRLITSKRLIELLLTQVRKLGAKARANDRADPEEISKMLKKARLEVEFADIRHTEKPRTVLGSADIDLSGVDTYSLSIHPRWSVWSHDGTLDWAQLSEKFNQ